MKNRQEEMIHSLVLMIIGALGLVFLVICKKLLLSAACYFFILTFYFWAGLNILKYLKVLLAAIVFAFGFFILSQLYPAKELRDIVINHWGPFYFYRAAALHGFQQWIKLAMLASLSMASGTVIDYTTILMNLMQTKRLSLFLGYPLLLALNSIALLKVELDRIKIISKQRKLPFFTRHFPMLPLLVFAIRHSQRGALALVTRGISKNKSFYFNYQTSKNDRFILLFFSLIYFLLVALNFYVLK